MDSFPADRHLGDYQLETLLHQTPGRRTWLAHQKSISRRAVIEELVDPLLHDVFLAEARAKAAVDFPKIASVYEAVDEPGECYYVCEVLPGRTLAELQLAGHTLHAASLVSILQHVAEANLYLEKSGHATSILGREDIHVEESGVVRLKNLAISAPRTPDQSIRDMIRLGTDLCAMVATDWPGANRMLTLLAWMRGEGIDQVLTWEQVRDYSARISSQLSVASPHRRKGIRLPRFLVPTLLVLTILGIATVSWIFLYKPQPKTVRPSLPPPIEIQAGIYTTPDGRQQELTAYRISGHPVTRGEYRAFLKTLDELAKEGDQKLFDHPEQPAHKSNHQPDGWAAFNALVSDRKNALLLDQPVTGIDWWDAYAYSDWQRTRMPTQQEWYAALGETPGGTLLEWTLNSSVNPANPLGNKVWVMIRNEKIQEWMADRSTRRPDLGFRILIPSK